ncbi:hypothetical protein [Nocardia aurantia]|uniref:Uncharacterized protein n=1 Tax=Nocardia aurantia TaxID=2585199 RepID=A0A7K0E262_9NOCA|nr:hypothetical protein [Nocardia aurantia]MQY31971.1 hypothetical protein [Nocardia aurantia]
MPFTLSPNQNFTDHVPPPPAGGGPAHTAVVVVQPTADGNPTPNFTVEVQFGESVPSENPRDLRTREITGRTVMVMRWYNTVTWSHPPQFGAPGAWVGTRTFDLGGAPVEDSFRIRNLGPGDIQVTIT